MISRMKRAIEALFLRHGYEIVPVGLPTDFDEAVRATIRYVDPYTMTAPARIMALCDSVRYVVRHDIPGDIVECGVWKGGSMMAVARTLMEHGARRTLHLFDTFEGMSEPTDADRNARGQSASEIMAQGKSRDPRWAMAFAPLGEVKRNLLSTGYDEHQIVFVRGRVEDTLPASAPSRIALLRLDTDWYESTYHELLHLYPRLSVGGVLIIDDYGYWEGARKAVDQYFEENQHRVLLTRIDHSARILVKLQE